VVARFEPVPAPEVGEPINALLATAAESISTGQKVDVNLNVPGGDEISLLCRSFDRMRTSIEKSLAMLTARE
jgi:HAMP domain-containing protein